MRKTAKYIVAAAIVASITISAMSKWESVITSVGKTAMLVFMFVLGLCTLYVLFDRTGRA